MKIRPVVTELSDADGPTDRWTDMTKLIIALSNFANTPKMKGKSQVAFGTSLRNIR